MTRPETGTRIDERTVPDYRPDTGDHERFAHYVEKDKILESAVTGSPVIALCGKVWVPGRDPNKFPVCPECQELYDLGPAGRKKFWKDRAKNGGGGFGFGGSGGGEG
jgi:hypothetical protein